MASGCRSQRSTVFQELAEEIQAHLDARMPTWKRDRPGVAEMTVAVMGCVVNGPGESRAANIGISLPGTGEQPRAPVYVDGEKVATLDGPTLAGDLLVNDVTDVMCHAPQVRAAAREAVAGHLTAAQYVEQLELHVVLPAGGRIDPADDQVVDIDHAPVLELHLLALGRERHQVAVWQRGKAPAAVKVGRDDSGDVFRRAKTQAPEKKHHYYSFFMMFCK